VIYNGFVMLLAFELALACAIPLVIGVALGAWLF
jgi:hypothetical protein